MSDPTSVLLIRRRHGRQAQPTAARSDCEREVKPAFPRAKFLATRLSQAGCDTLVQAAAAFSRQRSGIPFLVSQRGHKLKEERPVSAPQMVTPSLPVPEFHYNHRHGGSKLQIAECTQACTSRSSPVKRSMQPSNGEECHRICHRCVALVAHPNAVLVVLPTGTLRPERRRRLAGYTSVGFSAAQHAATRFEQRRSRTHMSRTNDRGEGPSL